MLLNRIGWNPNLVAELKIEPEDVERFTSLLLDFCEQFKGCFIHRAEMSRISYRKKILREYELVLL